MRFVVVSVAGPATQKSPANRGFFVGAKPTRVGVTDGSSWPLPPCPRRYAVRDDVRQRQGERPLLAGRSEARLAPLAEELGLEHRAFSLEQARQSISGVRVLLNLSLIHI